MSCSRSADATRTLGTGRLRLPDRHGWPDERGQLPLAGVLGKPGLIVDGKGQKATGAVGRATKQLEADGLPPLPES